MENVALRVTTFSVMENNHQIHYDEREKYEVQWGLP